MTDLAFINRIKHVVSKAGGQMALARATDISQGAVQRYLKGGEPTRRVLIRMAEAANVDLRWLMTGDESRINNTFLQSMLHINPDPATGWCEPGGIIDNEALKAKLIGLYVAFSHLEPDGLLSGTYCFADPESEPVESDIVFIQTQNGRHGLRKFKGLSREGLYAFLCYSHDQAHEPSPFMETMKKEQIQLLAPVLWRQMRRHN